VCSNLAREGDFEEIQRRYPGMFLFANNEHGLIIATRRRNSFTDDPWSMIPGGVLMIANYVLITTDTLGVLDVAKNRSGSMGELTEIVMNILGLSCVRYTDGIDQIRVQLNSEEHTMLRLKGIL
jgi:hypothetical protein